MLQQEVLLVCNVALVPTVLAPIAASVLHVLLVQSLLLVLLVVFYVILESMFQALEPLHVVLVMLDITLLLQDKRLARSVLLVNTILLLVLVCV
jgi:hypothetical protein